MVIKQKRNREFKKICMESFIIVNIYKFCLVYITKDNGHCSYFIINIFYCSTDKRLYFSKKRERENKIFDSLTFISTPPQHRLFFVLALCLICQYLVV